MIIKYLAFILLCFGVCAADEPPSWSVKRIDSENSEYFCWISFADSAIHLEPSKRKWKLEVFRADSSLVWAKEYSSTGYNSGLLSNGGESFVYIEYWFSDSGAVIQIHNKNNRNHAINGSVFLIDSADLHVTSSHRLWLADESPRLARDTLILKTIDGNTWKISISDGFMTKMELARIPYKPLIVFGFSIIMLVSTGLIWRSRRRLFNAHT